MPKVVVMRAGYGMEWVCTDSGAGTSGWLLETSAGLKPREMYDRGGVCRCRMVVL